MKILYSNRTLYPFEGGADISALTLLENLSKKHDVSAVYIGKKLENSKIKSYPQNIKQRKGLWINLYFLNKKWEKILSKIIENEKPDLLITQDYFIAPSIKVAKRYNLKSIVFLRSYLHLSIDNCKTYMPEQNKFGRSSDIIYQLQYPFYKKVVKENQKAIKNADLVCSVSNYMKEVTSKYCNVKSEVIRPFISFKECKANSKGDYITFINPDKHKGVDIFDKITARLHEKKFLVIGKNYKSKRNNVEVFDYLDRKEIFSITRLLLAPSIFPDPHPRVVIEAMANGIPCVVSGRGGLIEEAEGAGTIIWNIFNIDDWVRAIKDFDDEKIYKDVSKKAKKKALNFEDKVQFKKFSLLLNKLMKND